MGREICGRKLLICRVLRFGLTRYDAGSDPCHPAGSQTRENLPVEKYASPFHTLLYCVLCLSVQTSICLRTDPNWSPPKPAVKLFVNDDIQTSQA